jgi:hypothetical protein
MTDETCGNYMFEDLGSCVVAKVVQTFRVGHHLSHTFY